MSPTSVKKKTNIKVGATCVYLSIKNFIVITVIAAREKNF